MFSPTVTWLCNPAFGSQLLPAPLFQEGVNVHPPGVMMDLRGWGRRQLGCHCLRVLQESGAES